VQVVVVKMKTPLGVRVLVVVRVLFAFLAVMVIETPAIPVGWVDFLVTFSNLDDGVVRELYD